MHELGSFVTHNKLPELGSGEVVSSDKGTIRIRFASGERSFLIEAVSRHLVVTLEAPPAPEKRAASKKASKRRAASS